METQLDSEEVSVVLRGQFNPAVFHPAWFAAAQLIRKQEAEAAVIKVIHPTAAVFTVEWLQFNATQDRFQLSTTQAAYFEPIRDLMLGTLELIFAPLKAIGFNYHSHYRMSSEDAWHTVGHRLAPKEVWKGLLDEPGMLDITMEGKRPDKRPGSINVKVQPSKKIVPGIYITVNDHYQLALEEELIRDVNEAKTILQKQWSPFMENARKIAKGLSALGGPVQ
jgi:hypothetical protein